MGWYLFTLVALFLPFSHGQNLQAVTKPFAGPCNKNFVSSIETYWKKAGTPQRVLQQMADTRQYTVLHTSYDNFISEVKCVHLKYTKGVIDALIIPSEGNQRVVTYDVKEDRNGTIYGKLQKLDVPALRWRWYTIQFNKGVVASYVCSDMQGSQDPPLVEIMVATGERHPFNPSEVNRLHTMLEGWGAKIKHSFDSECQLTELNNTRTSS